MDLSELAGRRALGNATADDYVRWAEGRLCDGVDSDDVAVLASFGLAKNPDSREIESWFHKALDDLGLTLPRRDQALLCYSRDICRRIVAAAVSPDDGLQLLEPFYRATEYARSIFMIWGELAEDVSLLCEGEQPIFNSGLNNANMTSFIRDVASQYLVLSELDLPGNFFELHACSKCGFIGECDWQRLEKPWSPALLFRLIYRRGRSLRAICRACQNSFPRNMSDYAAREQYLASL